MGDQSAIGSLRDPAVLRCPYPTFDAIRTESPVYWHPDLPDIGLVTRYDDVLHVLRDTETFSNDAYEKLRSEGVASSPRVKEVLARGFPPAKVLAQDDDPRHDYHASLLKPYLTTRQVRSMETRIRGYIKGLMDVLSDGQPFDWVEDFAKPLAIAVMCDFVGITDEYRDVVVRGAAAEAALLGSLAEEEVLVRAAEDWVELQQYAAREIRARQANPTTDLISNVANTPPPEGVAPLTMAEAVHLVKLAFVAGNETTRAALSAAALRLTENPDLIPRLQTDQKALNSFVEETLRVDAPVLMLFRVTTKDTELSGQKINKGEILAVVFSAANRDASEFGCPADFDIERGNVRRHLTFGFGTHYCLGAPIARSELRLAIRALVDRFDVLELDGGAKPEYSSSFLVHSMTHLRVVGRRRTNSFATVNST